MPRVSVILTSFNHAKYLKDAIDSVINQTYHDFELIIWDDASDDNSWDIINSYNDSRIKAFRNLERKRGVWGLNKAISEVATGEYIAVHHSDDVWDTTKLEKQLRYLDTNRNIGAVFTRALIINEQGGSFKDETHFYYSIFDQENRSRHEWLRRFFIQGNALCHPSVVIRKECFHECGLYQYGLAQVADFEMWIRLCLKYEIHVIPEKLTHFRILDNEKNTSGSRSDSRIRGMYEYYLILQNYRKIATYVELLSIFPEAKDYYISDFCDTDFILAMVSLKLKPYFFTSLFAQNILYEIISDVTRYALVKEKYEFNHLKFITFTGSNDIFSREELLQLNQNILTSGHKFKELETYTKSLQNELSNQRTANEDTNEKNHQLTEQFKKLETYTKSLQDELSNQRSVNEDTNEKNHQLTEQFNELETYTKSLQVELAKQIKNQKQLQYQINQTGLQNKALSNHFESLENESKQLNLKIKEIETKLNLIRSSPLKPFVNYILKKVES